MEGKTCGTCACKVSYYCDVTTWAVEDGDECSVPPEFGGDSWMPRTCGTCAHCADRHGPKQPMASHVCMDMGTLIIDPDRPNCAGLYYEERTESVEQVINEMIYCIVRLSERGECGEVMDEGLAAREYNAGLTPCYQAFADRLEALGMTLDGR
jgi:hypothetical protein|nr:MAG TPA: hypothetical protein [Caudoviricetes sp.]